MKKLIKAVLVMLTLLLLFGCKTADTEMVYHVVDDAGEEVSSFTLSQIKAGMTRREIMNLLVGPWKPMMNSGITDFYYKTMIWKLADGSRLYVYFNNDLPITEEIVKNREEFFDGFWRDHFTVVDASIYTPEKPEMHLPKEWTDGSRTISDDDCTLIKQGMTFKQVREVIGNPGLIVSEDFEHKLVVMEWNLNSQYSFVSFIIEFEISGDTVDEETLIVKNCGRME